LLVTNGIKDELRELTNMYQIVPVLSVCGFPANGLARYLLERTEELDFTRPRPEFMNASDRLRGKILALTTSEA